MKDKLSRYMDACFPILYVNTFEEAKIEKDITEVADNRNIIFWSMARGCNEYSCTNKSYETVCESEKLNQLLSFGIMDDYDFERKLIVIKDAHNCLEDQMTVSLLKELAIKISAGFECTVILLSSILKIPMELEKYITVIEQERNEDIDLIIREFINEQEIPMISDDLFNKMVVAFKGLSEFEINSILSLALAEDGELSEKDIQLIFEQKKQLILKSGILELIKANEKIDDIGGLENLKEWLSKKAKVIKNWSKAEKFGVAMPKGVLIAGVPGCGKSLTAKAAASLFEVPILRLDIGKLMGKYLGESEGNLRKAISLAEAISPCVLWVDELEKAFAGVGSDGGHEVTTRLFGTFLTWMQEKTSSTFVVATANDITKMPPELLRKGRFDEIFFVGLPSSVERKKIFEIHISKRRKEDLKKINIQHLVEKTEGYSGADIEGVVKEAIESAFANDSKTVTTEEILKAIKNTNSLSVIMKDSLDKMIEESKKRKFKNASK